MSTEREPLLSNAKKEAMCGDLLNAEQVSKYAFGEAVGRRRGVELAREFYEDLITTGKLRVVEECVVKLSDDEFWPEMPVFGCNGRGPVTNDITWCPYCGKKIKR